MCFKVSRYLESYCRHDDILAVNNDLSVILGISTIFDWIENLFNEVKRDLKGKILLPSIKYKESMDLILNNLRAVAVNIDYNLLKEGSYQLEDYTLVMDNRPVDYKSDDEGMQDQPSLLNDGTITFILHPGRL